MKITSSVSALARDCDPVSKQNKTKQNKNPEKTPVTGGAKTPDWELSESDGWKNST
jgi:hypothetical protein